jgi:hypothetical protein
MGPSTERCSNSTSVPCLHPAKNRNRRIIFPGWPNSTAAAIARLSRVTIVVRPFVPPDAAGWPERAGTFGVVLSVSSPTFRPDTGGWQPTDSYSRLNFLERMVVEEQRLGHCHETIRT